MIIGHDVIRRELEENDYQAVLLLGPESVGKRALARYIVGRKGAGGNFLSVPELTAPRAREIRDFVMQAPLSGGQAFVLAELDGAAEQAQNILLKVLEEPPPCARFLLVASRPVLPTITSRCITVRFGLLTDGQVAQVLIAGGMDPEAAEKQALLGGGRVRPAMEGVSSQSRARVSAVLRAVADSDSVKLDTALREWGAEDHQLLGTWAAEAAVARWRVFDRAFAPRLDKWAARTILGRLSGQSLASPRLAATTALAPLCLRR